MSQIEVNTNYNSVNVENTINTIDVNQDFGNILIVPQQTTNIVEVVTPGPQGPQGPPGDPTPLTGSFVTTSSFYAFTSSYTTGSFTGSFAGDGSGLTNISASNVVGLNLSQIASGSATASISPNNGFVVNTNTTITGSLFVTNGITGSLFGTSSFALTASYASNVPLTASFAVSASQAISASYAVSASYEIVYEESSSYADYAVSASQAVTASYALNVPLTASFAVSASQAVTASYVTPLVQNVTITGSILFDGGSTGSGASIVPNNGLANSLDLIAGTGGWVELSSNDGNQYVWVDDNGTYLITNWNVDAKQWTFNKSGSLTAPGDILVNGLVSASNGFTGSLEGTASYALTASYASNVPETASFAVSASQAVTASYAFNIADQGYNFTQTTAAVTWSINHNLDTLIPLVDVYDPIYSQLIPAQVISIDTNNLEVRFSSPNSGYAIVSKGSGVSSAYAATASYAITASYSNYTGYNFIQDVSSDTWVINHNLNNQYPLVQVYTSDNLAILPASISGSDFNTTIITFSSARTGYVRIV
jgi:hypothetical protein